MAAERSGLSAPRVLFLCECSKFGIALDPNSSRNTITLGEDAMAIDLPVEVVSHQD